MPAAQRREVVAAGGAAVGVGDDVVGVAASAGLVHQGNTQVRSRSAAWSASRSGTSYWSTCRWSVEVDHRLDDHLGERGVQPFADLVDGDQPASARLRPGRTGCPGRGGRGRRSAGPARPGRVLGGPGWSGGGRSGPAPATGGRPGSPRIRRRRGRLLRGRPGSPGPGRRPGPAHRGSGRCRSNETWVCSIARVPAVGRLPALLLGFGGHEPADRVGDQPVDLRRTDPVRVGGDVVVHEPRRRQRQADGLPGDPPGTPRRQLTGDDTCPGLGEPVAQLDGLTQVLLADLGREPDRERELGHAELRHQRRTRVPRSPTAGHRTETAAPRRGSTRPGAGPPTRLRPEEIDLGRIGRLPTVAGALEDRLCGVEGGARGHASILLEHMFESRLDSDYFRD